MGITQLSREVQLQLWLSCPYQLLPAKLVNDTTFMLQWLNCDSNKVVTAGDFIYYCKLYHEDSRHQPHSTDKRLSNYKRHRVRKQIDGATMSLIARDIVAPSIWLSTSMS